MAESKPPRHGQIRISTMRPEHAKKHLADMTASMSEVHDYGSHGTGFSSQGGFAPAAGADYTTSSADSVGDVDSGGPTGL